MRLYETHRVERSVLAQVVLSRSDSSEAADSLLELGRLADTAGFEVAGQITQNRDKPDGGTRSAKARSIDLKALVAGPAPTP
jgi:GTP-binding protein HflX